MTSNVRPSLSKSASSRNTFIIIGIIAVAIVAAVVAILAANSDAAVSAQSYQGIPMSRQADGGMVLGNPDSRITIVEFADFGCPHCIDYKPTMERVINEYVKTGKARLEYRTFPTAGGQLTAFMGAIAVCLDDQRQGAFWEAKDILYGMAASGQYDGNSGRVLAERLGLDYSQALACAQSQKQVNTDIALANQAGVNGTPAVLIRVDNGDIEWIPGWQRGGVPYEVLATTIAAYQ